MKTNYLKTFSLILIISINSANAQYQSIFGSNQTSWNMKTEQLFGAVNDSISYISDTLISSVLNKKVKYFRGSSEMATFLIREDTTQGKVWCSFINDTTQYTIYDLSLSVGDTFRVYIDGGTYVVDSVYYQSSRKHIRLDYFFSSTIGKKFVMIEGVGTNIGLMYHNGNVGNIGPYLLCQHKNSLVNFINNHPLYSGQCNISTVGITESYLESKITIFPNPSSNLLFINFEKEVEIQQISISNIEGKIIKIYTDNFEELNIKHIPLGIFFLKIYLHNKVITKKVVIE